MDNNLDNIFQNAMDLVTDLKEYIENNKKITETRLPNPNDIYISEELSKMTANITAMVSWLFLYKALKNNEIEPQVLLDGGNELATKFKEINSKIDKDEYPIDFLKLKDEIIQLQTEVSDLHQDFSRHFVN